MDANGGAEREIVELHEAWFAAAAAKDLDASMAPISPEIVSYEHTAPLQVTDLAGVREECRRGFELASDDFRTLTNALMQGLFGMDVEAFRRFKQLGPENLRDHMTDLELALTTFAETTSAYLHKSRDSIGLDALLRDTTDAASSAHAALSHLEQSQGQPLTTPQNHTTPLFKKHRLSA